MGVEARRLALRGAGWVFGLYLVATVAAVGFADSLIFFPPPPSYDDGLDGLVRLPTTTGDTIAARWVEARGAEVAVLFAHGNAEDIGHGRYHADGYADLGVSVLSFDYPGYGLSTGTPSEEGAYAAAEAGWTFVRERGFEPERIVVHGRSLGGGVVSHVAAREPTGGVVLESTFVSAYRVMTRARLLPVDQFGTFDRLDRIEAPILVVHGGRDAVIAPWHGRLLYDAIPEERRALLWVERAGHNDLEMVAGTAYWEALSAFVGRVGGASVGDGASEEGVSGDGR